MKKYLLVALCAIVFGGATSYLVVKGLLNGEESVTYVHSRRKSRGNENRYLSYR